MSWQWLVSRKSWSCRRKGLDCLWLQTRQDRETVMNPMALEYLEAHYNCASPKINIRRQQKLQSSSQCKLANKDISFVTLWYISCLYLRLMCNHLQLTKVTVVYRASHGIRASTLCRGSRRRCHASDTQTLSVMILGINKVMQGGWIRSD